jgi:hypothetical protein
MPGKRIFDGLRYGVIAALAVFLLSATEHHGQVKFGGLPVPGATVTATQADKTFTAVTDPQGAYSFPDLSDGTWALQIEMPGFAAFRQQVQVAPDTPASEWNLTMLRLSEMHGVVAPAPQPAAPPAPVTAGRTKNAPPAPTNTPGSFQRTNVNAANPTAATPGTPAETDAGASTNDELSQRAADGFLINGTANNAASSPFAMAQAFGNNRRGSRSLYNGNLGFIFDNSTFDARPFSLTGQDTPRPDYNHIQGVFAFGGPIKIPHFIRNGPNFFVNYQWTRNRNASTGTGLMPDKNERMGDFSQVLNPQGQPVQLIDPTTRMPLPTPVIPASEISPQALSLLNYYPYPNFPGGTQYNYQIPLLGVTHQDSLQTRLNKTIGRKDQLSFMFALQSTRSDNPNLFGFLDTSNVLGLNVNANWRHHFSPRFFINLGYQFSRSASRFTPFFENRENVSEIAQIAGNNQEPINWGPPTLTFASGFSGLSDGLPSFTRNQTSGMSLDNFWARGRHNISFGGDFRRQEFNLRTQQDPRGTFTFTGAAAGYDFAGFLLGIPDTSSIAFGNADKYFRASTYDSYINDDWRMNPAFTLNFGVRWEYWSPITEKYGRLVNLDIAPGFNAEAAVTGTNPIGSLTGQTYPDSLIHPDKGAVQPRIAFSWRPLAASSMVVRAGYGVYYNTSVYLPIATQMAQQYPFSKSLSVQGTPGNLLSMADGFNASAPVSNTFGVDPNFRIGYSQNWQVSVQRDLPGALVVTGSYLGSKGTREQQEFLPNTFPAGAANPCPICPSGFIYLASNGNATRNAGQLQLRRRLQSGFTASLQYIFSKSIDDGALGGKNQGGYLIAQNWLDLAAERALSNFDQRHQLSLQAQYTTGMGLHGGTLVNGWKGALFKEWTTTTQITATTGMPLTPVDFLAVAGTGVTGSIRPEYTGAPLYSAPAGLFLNPAAYAAPPPGQWGNAGRNSITGPSQFTLNASFGRVFQVTERLGLDFRIDATNALNHVTFPSWNTTVNSSQFGLANPANAMRSVQTTLRLRF